MWKYLFTLAAALFAVTSRAQRYLGIETSDWSAINSVYLNPATIADCKENLSIGIFSLSALVDNNLGFIPKIPDLGSEISANNNIFTQSAKRNFSALAPAAEIRGPGIMATLNDRLSLALTTDIRGIDQFNNFDPVLYKALAPQGGAPDQNYTVNAKNFNWTAHLWSEIGISMGAVLKQWYRGRLNAGITIRRLGGIGYISITGKNMDVTFNEGSDSFVAKNSDVDYSSSVDNANTKNLTNITPSGLMKNLFTNTAGNGIGGDIGVTYRYRVGFADKADYLESNTSNDFIFSVAVTDIGAIDYFNSSNKAVRVTGTGEDLSGTGITKNVNSVDSFIKYAARQGFSIDTESATKRVYLPTALVTSADAQIYGRFFANLLFIGNLANRQNFGNSYYNQITLTPRYDYHRMTISLPITYSMLAHDMKMGFGARYAGFVIGSDDATALLSKHAYGFGMYFGGYIPIFKRAYDPLGLHWKW